MSRHVHRSSSGRFELREHWQLDADGEVVYTGWSVWGRRAGGWECIGQATTIGDAKRLVEHDIWTRPLEASQ